MSWDEDDDDGWLVDDEGDLRPDVAREIAPQGASNDELAGGIGCAVLLGIALVVLGKLAGC